MVSNESNTKKRSGDPRILVVRDRYAKVNAVNAIEKIGLHGTVILRASGFSISDAVNVANIVTQKMLTGTSKVQKVTVDSIERRETGALISTIEITLVKLPL